MNFNEWKKLQAEKLGAVVSHDAPEPGEGLHGEHMSRLPNSSGDFPSPGHVDLGDTDPAHAGSASQHAGIENLPSSVSPSSIAADARRRADQMWGGGR